MADISYIVPNYNCAPYLKGCVDTLLAQKQGRVVVVDDGSTDDSLEVLYEYRDHIQVISLPENRGANAARNAGLRYVEQTHGISINSFVAFCDADATYFPQFGERLSKALQSGKMAAAAYCHWEAEVQDGSVKEMQLVDWDEERLWWDMLTIPMPSMIRAINLPHNDLDENNKWRDDWKLWMWMAERGNHAVRVPEILFRHKFREDGKTRVLSRDPEEVAIDRARARRRYCSLSRLPGPVVCLVYHDQANAPEGISGHCLQHLERYSGVPLHVCRLGDFPEHNTFTSQSISTDYLGAIPEDAYLLIVRSDAYIGPECVERMLWWLRMMPSIGACGPILLDDSEQSLLKMADDEQATEEIIQARGLLPDFRAAAKRLSRKKQLKPMAISPVCAMVRPEAVPLIDWSDGVWCQKILDAKFDVVAIHDALCLFGEGAKKSYWEG